MISKRNHSSKQGLFGRVSSGALIAMMAFSATACAESEADSTAASDAPGKIELAQVDQTPNDTKAVETAKTPEAPSDQAETTKSVEPSVADEASRQIAEKRAALLKDAVTAIEESRKAVTALDDDDAEAALEALAAATGKLDIIVAREPDLALAPVSVTAIREDLIATVDGVKRLRRNIEDLIDDGEIQKAKPLIETFGSEIVITETSIPLATYPDAIKDVAALIDDGEIEAAKVALDTALSTMVITETVVPLPLLRAHAMLELAEDVLDEETTTEAEAKAESISGDNQEDPMTQAERLRENAAYQIELAKAFGYGDKSLYRQLERDLDKLKDRIADEKDTGDLFASLRRQITGLMPGHDE